MNGEQCREEPVRQWTPVMPPVPFLLIDQLNLPTVPAISMRSNTERHIASTWARTIIRSDDAGCIDTIASNLDDAGSFFSHPGNIGQNIDEDECHPVGGVAGACRTGGIDTNASVPPSSQKLKSAPFPTARPLDIQAIKSVSQIPNLSTTSLFEGNSNIPSGNIGHSSSHPNKTETVEEMMGGCKSTVTLSVSTDAVSMSAQGSAETLSGGKWQSMSPFRLLPNMIYSGTHGKCSGVGPGDTALLFSPLGNIGQNIDGDEFKPAGAVAGTCRTGGIDTKSSVPPGFQELKSAPLPTARPSDVRAIKSASQTPTLPILSLFEGDLNNPSGDNRLASSHSNTSETENEMMYGCKSMVTFSVSLELVAVSKSAQERTAEELSGGKWRSMAPFQLLPHMIYSGTKSSVAPGFQELKSAKSSVPPGFQELKSAPLPTARPLDLRAIKSASQTPTLPVLSLFEGDLNNPSGNNRLVSSHPNTSETEKVMMGGCKSVVTFSVSSDVVSKSAQERTAEKLSGGKWQSMTPFQLLPHMIYSGTHGKSSGVGSADNFDATQDSPAEQCLNSAGDQGDDKEVSGVEKEAHSVSIGQIEANTCASQTPSTSHSELSERPKLKLLPRTKLLESVLGEHSKQEYQQSLVSIKLETGSGIHANANTLKQGFTICESASKPIERPRLNLKPRSLPLEQSKTAIEVNRRSLFGDARPREEVLEERGIWQTQSSRRNRNQNRQPKEQLKLTPSDCSRVFRV